MDLVMDPPLVAVPKLFLAFHFLKMFPTPHLYNIFSVEKHDKFIFLI